MRIRVNVPPGAECSAEFIGSKLITEYRSPISPCVLYGQLGEYTDQHTHSSAAPMRKTRSGAHMEEAT